MAGSVNKVILVGNLGRDPEIRYLQDGAKVANLSVATSETWTDKATGERKDRTEWHRVVVFNDRLVDITEKYLRKGAKVFIEGQLQTRKWTDTASNQERYTTEVVLSKYRGELTMLDVRSNVSDEASQTSSGVSGSSSAITGGSAQKNPFDTLEDDVPF